MVSGWEHGRAGWIHHGCRCRRCHRALLEYHRVRRAAEVLARGGDPAGQHPPGRARRRVDELLAAGWTQCRVAAAAGVSHATVSRIAHRRTRHVSRIVERALLALQP